MYLKKRSVFLCMMAAVAVLLIPCIGCGSSSSTNNSNPGGLTQAQAQTLADETSIDLVAAFSDAISSSGHVEGVAGQVSDPLNSGRKSNLLAVISKNKHISSELTPAGTIGPLTYDCVNGTITINGSTSGSSGSGSLNLTLTPTNCDDGTLTYNGNPDITLRASGTDNGTTTTGTLNIGGDVSFVPDTTGAFPSSSCGIGISASASFTDATGAAASCTYSGEMCGQTVSGSCMPPQ